jgi:hypothetical protein
MAREVLMVVIESSYGIPKTSPVLGTDSFYMRLDQDNAFAVEADPVQQDILYGGGVATVADTISDVVAVKGAFNFLLYPGIWSQILLNWAITPINSGRTAPWVTTAGSPVSLPVGDLASLSFYHGILEEDGTTWQRTRYAGMKCDDWQITASEDGNNRAFRISGNMTGIRPVGNAWDSSADPNNTEFPTPPAAESSYPVGPYSFGHLGSGTGEVLLGSSSGTNRAASCASLKIGAKNTFDPKYYTSRFLQTCRFLGRAASCDATLRLKVSPDDRASYRALTAQTCTLLLDNGVNTVTIDMKGNTLLAPYKRDLKNANEYMQNLTYKGRWSSSAATDLTLATT